MLNISHEAQDALLKIGSRDALQDCADLVALLRAELQPGDVVARACLSIIDRIEGVTTIDEALVWSRQGYAEFDQAVGIRMVPVSNPVTGVQALPFKVGGA